MDWTKSANMSSGFMCAFSLPYHMYTLHVTAEIIFQLTPVSLSHWATSLPGNLAQEEGIEKCINK